MDRTEYIQIRVTPEQKRLMRELGQNYAGGMSEALRRLIETQNHKDERAAAQLTDEELEVAQRLGVRPADYLAAKGGGANGRT